jgi:hypothetical protein
MAICRVHSSHTLDHSSYILDSHGLDISLISCALLPFFTYLRQHISCPSELGVARAVFVDHGDDGEVGERIEDVDWPLFFGVGRGEDGFVEEIGHGHAPVLGDEIDEPGGGHLLLG